MATRLEITHGLIAERDRLSTSADTLSVTRPSTGSKTRTKGVLFIVVGSSVPGPRAREATALVAETIRHEYYYDESAGVPVCLEKAVKSADRRLRSSREGAGLPLGSLGVAAAVIRNNELYLATLGPAEAYLVRSARLLIPDRSAPAGLPSDGSRTVDVWRGELHVGDGLLLVSRNVTETVGTEELKSAVLTLHPQAAVDHLHHLFVATGGAGSDGLIAVEAGEQTARVSTRPTAPVVAAYGNLPGPVPEPVGGAVASATLGLRDGLDGLRDRFWSAMPRREARPREISASNSRAETRRRAAMGLLALVAVVLVAGLLLAIVPRASDSVSLPQVAGSDSALGAALDATNRADNLLGTEPDTALEFYREAWAEIEQARATGLQAPALEDLEARVTAGLDTLYNARHPTIKRLAKLPDGQDPDQLVQGPRNGAIYIDRNEGTVVRVNLKNGKAAKVVRTDQKASGGRTIGRPMQLAAADYYVIIVDDKARPFRWSPSNSAGAGTLAKINLRGRSGFEKNHGDVEAYVPGSNIAYRLYVAEPSLNQIMRYAQTQDRSAFDSPTPYLASQSAEVADYDQLYVDWDVYALFDNTLRRHRYQKYDGTFALDELPDDSDLRPGHEYTMVDGSGRATTDGRVYLYDAEHGRIVGFRKEDGSYLGQWSPRAEGGEMNDVRGMYVIEGGLNKKGKRKNDALVWITPDGIYRANLAAG
jgi:hypothetical protein